uniref:Uncharacterized protein n=1 Tax=Rhizophora mucronata TaxID=61149 RepID=A0A2P2NAC6_RHIMU
MIKQLELVTSIALQCFLCGQDWVTILQGLISILLPLKTYNK